MPLGEFPMLGSWCTPSGSGIVDVLGVRIAQIELSMQRSIDVCYVALFVRLEMPRGCTYRGLTENVEKQSSRAL